jgi:hypothetical protein
MDQSYVTVIFTSTFHDISYEPSEPHTPETRTSEISPDEVIISLYPTKLTTSGWLIQQTAMWELIIVLFSGLPGGKLASEMYPEKFTLGTWDEISRGFYLLRDIKTS